MTQDHNLRNDLPQISVRLCWVILYLLLLLIDNGIIKFRGILTDNFVVEHVGLLVILFMLPYIYVATRSDLFKAQETMRTLIIGIILHLVTIGTTIACLIINSLYAKEASSFITSIWFSLFIVIYAIISAIFYIVRRKAFMSDNEVSD